MKIKILFLLLLSVVATYGETIDEIQLGARDVPFSISYGIWDIPEGSKKYVCLTLKEPADLQITVSQTLTDGQKPLMMLFYSYQMHMLCTNYDSNVSMEAGKTVTIRNVPAGDYKLYVDAKNFSTLQIQGQSRTWTTQPWTWEVSTTPSSRRSWDAPAPYSTCTMAVGLPMARLPIGSTSTAPWISGPAIPVHPPFPPHACT